MYNNNNNNNNKLPLSRIEWNNKWVKALPVLMHVHIFDRLFVPIKLMSMSWEPYSVTRVPLCPQT